MWWSFGESGKKQSGFSLPELMMAAAIMGGLSLAFMKLTQNGVEGGKRVEAGGQVEETKREILGVLSNRDACIKTFALFNNFSDVVGGGTKTIPSIRDKNNTVRFSANQVFPGVVRLASIEVKDYNAVKSTAGLLLTFNYKLNSNVNMTKVKRFDLQLELDAANNLLGCVAMAGIQTIDPKQLCDTVIGFDSAGASYFRNSECTFARASCEKSGGKWELPGETCALSADQKFKVRKEACDSERGYLRKGTEGWSYSIESLMSYTACTVADITANNKCYCQTRFRKKIWETLPAPTVTDGAGGQSKKLVLAPGKFSVVSQIQTLSNPFPDGDNRPRFVRIKATIGITNVSPDNATKWLTGSIGVYKKSRSAYHAQADWIASVSSTDYNSIFTVGGYKFMPWHGTGNNMVDNHNSGIPFMHISAGSRENVIVLSYETTLIPGDTFTVILYTHNGGTEILAGRAAWEIDHFTDNSEFGYGATGMP